MFCYRLCCIDNAGLDGVNNELGLSMFCYRLCCIDNTGLDGANNEL